MKRIIVILALMSCLAIQAKTFVRSYSYNASEADSKITARSIALEQVKTLLLEEVGVYISSSIINKESEANGTVQSLTEKDIQVLSAGITQTKILQESWNGEVYNLKAEITLDEKDVLQKLDDLINNTKTLETLEKNRNTANAAMEELERLKTELQQEKDKSKQLLLQNAYTAEAGKLSALEYYDQAEEISSHDSGDMKAALKLYQQATIADSTFADAWYHLAYSYLYTDNVGLARESFQKAYSLNGDPKALTGLAYSYSDTKDYSTALSYYEQAYEQLPDNETLAHIADMYYQMRDYPKAKEVYLGILAKDPDNFTAINYISGVYLALKEYDNAIACYNKLLQMDADPANMYSSIASAYMDKGDYPSAVKYYKMVTDLTPTAWWNWSYLTKAYYSAGDYQNAIKSATRLLQLQPNDSGTEEMMGNSYLQLNDLANGQKYHLLAAKHGSTNSQNWCTKQNLKW